MWRIVCSSMLLLQPRIISFARAQCSIPAKDALHSQSPVFLGYNSFFKYPNVKTVTDLSFDWYEDRLLYCPGGQLSIKESAGDTSLNAVPSKPFGLPPVVRCLTGNSFVLQHDSQYRVGVTLDQFQCSEKPAVLAFYDYGGQVCSDLNGNIGHVIFLGFDIDEATGKRLGVIKVCYEDARATTLWSKHLVPPSIHGRVVFKVPSSKDPTKSKPLGNEFTKGVGFDDVTVKKNYESCSQTQVFRKLLKDSVRIDMFKDEHGNPIEERMLLPYQLEELNDRLKEEVDRYIYFNNTNRENNRMLVKGHLAPRGDFYYLVEERSSFFYSNALPMWSTINGGHWSGMENWVRDLAAQKNCLLDVWTGGLGTLQVQDKDVYLGQRRGTPVMPVPLVLFKIVRCQALNEAIVFLAINDPDLDIDPMQRLDHIFCEKEYEACAQIKSNWATDVQKGFMYCCEYFDFVRHPFVQNNIQIPVTDMDPNVRPLITQFGT